MDHEAAAGLGAAPAPLSPIDLLTAALLEGLEDMAASPNEWTALISTASHSPLHAAARADPAVGPRLQLPGVRLLRALPRPAWDALGDAEEGGATPEELLLALGWAVNGFMGDPDAPGRRAVPAHGTLLLVAGGAGAAEVVGVAQGGAPGELLYMVRGAGALAQLSRGAVAVLGHERGVVVDQLRALVPLEGRRAGDGGGGGGGGDAQ